MPLLLLEMNHELVKIQQTRECLATTAAGAVFPSYCLSCGSYKKFFVTVTGYMKSLFWTSNDAAYCIALYCTVLNSFVMYLFTVLMALSTAVTTQHGIL
jgi:hypothetical protein